MATPLALKGLLSATERIPDTWFDKIPYYQSAEVKAANKAKKQAKKDKGRRRTHSTDDKYRHERRRTEDGRPRRSRDDDSDDDRRNGRRRSYDDEYDDDKRKDRREGRRHYDDDDDPYRQSKHDHEKYRHPTEPAIYGSSNQVPRQEQHRASVPVNMAYPTAGGAAAHAAYYQDDSRPNSSGPTGAYVPYADIYQSPAKTDFSHDPSYKATYGSDRAKGAHSSSNHSSRRYSSHNGRQPKQRGRSDRENDYESDSYSSDEDRQRRRHRRERPRSRARSQDDGYGRSKGSRR